LSLCPFAGNMHAAFHSRVPLLPNARYSRWLELLQMRLPQPLEAHLTTCEDVNRCEVDDWFRGGSGQHDSVQRWARPYSSTDLSWCMGLERNFLSVFQPTTCSSHEPNFAGPYYVFFLKRYKIRFGDFGVTARGLRFKVLDIWGLDRGEKIPANHGEECSWRCDSTTKVGNLA
jgi:hypothetical protein